MKTAVLEFQRNRVKRRAVAAASSDMLKIIVELRSALRGIGKAIEAVERLAVTQLDAEAPRTRIERKPRSGKKLRKGRVVAIPHLIGARDNQPDIPERAGAQT